jgi:hypothetical protein
VEKALAPSMVRVMCQLPYGLGSATMSSGFFIGSGLILDKEKGLVRTHILPSRVAILDVELDTSCFVPLSGLLNRPRLHSTFEPFWDCRDSITNNINTSNNHRRNH